MRFYGINIKKVLPMKHFTPESFKPSEQTLDIIRQYAYTFRVNNKQALCLN